MRKPQASTAGPPLQSPISAVNGLNFLQGLTSKTTPGKVFKSSILTHEMTYSALRTLMQSPRCNNSAAESKCGYEPKTSLKVRRSLVSRECIDSIRTRLRNLALTKLCKSLRVSIWLTTDVVEGTPPALHLNHIAHDVLLISIHRMYRLAGNQKVCFEMKC